MKNLFKIPKLNLIRFLKPYKVLAMAMLLPLVGGWGATSCDLLKKTNPVTSIKDDLTKLPPETQEGKNTFGCLVNGKVWRNQGTVSFYESNLSISKTDNLLVVAYKKIPSISESISLAIIANEQGKYKLDYQNAALFFDDLKGCNEARHTPLSGNLEITKYQIIQNEGSKRLIVAGRFSFVTLAYPCGDTIRVTDGRFDIKL